MPRKRPRNNSLAILEDNQRRRDGNGLVRRLDEGYVAMRIPEFDDPDNEIIGYHTLVKLFPDLKSKDKDVRLKAWKLLEASELGDKYRVTKRSPRQVQRAVRNGNHGIIVK